MATTEYFAFRLLISHEIMDVCVGCATPVHIGLKSVVLRDANCPTGPLEAAVLSTAIRLPKIAANSTVSVDQTTVPLFFLEARPNPAMGRQLFVDFSLPDGTPAWLELLDVSGRRVARREVGGLGPGRPSGQPHRG